MTTLGARALEHQVAVVLLTREVDDLQGGWSMEEKQI
jgi:hypothetical protein